MRTTAEVVKVKEVFAWIEKQREVQLRATTRDGKPVVLNAEETRMLAERLMKLARILDSLEAQRGEASSNTSNDAQGPEGDG